MLRIRTFGITAEEIVDDSIGDAIIGKNSLATDNVYDWVKQANNEVHTFESAFMNFTWKSASVFGTTGITQFNKLESKAGAYGYISSVSSSASVLVGNFDNINEGNRPYGDAYAYMVMNYGNTGNSQAESAITITFNGTPTKALVYENGIAKVYTLASNTLTLNLQLGEGAFVIPLV